MKSIKSQIANVTVFNDRALVVRTSSNVLKNGSYVLVFENLPSGIDSGSIQVNGFGYSFL